MSIKNKLKSVNGNFEKLIFGFAVVAISSCIIHLILVLIFTFFKLDLGILNFLDLIILLGILNLFG
jgi:hypothetical protein